MPKCKRYAGEAGFDKFCQLELGHDGPHNFSDPSELPVELVFLILKHLKELQQISPNHILVKAAADALEGYCATHGRARPCEPCGEYHQHELLDVPAFLRRQAD